MILKCGPEYESDILSYIGRDYPSCLYLFLNLTKYGFDSAKLDVFIQKDNDSITSVLMKYYSCLHVYSRENNFDPLELGAFIAQNAFTIIYCTMVTANKIYVSLPNETVEKSTLTIGWVAQIKKVDKEARGLAIYSHKEDFEQVVRLIHEDEDIGRSYKYEELARQLEERNHDGYARNMVIKQDGLIIAHACTNAEIENIAVVAELLVRKDYRRKGYASEIWRDICGKLLKEGKEVYSFYYSEESRSLHKKIGFNEVREWAKIVIAFNE